MQAYGRALALESGRLYCLVQSSAIHLALGAHADALRSCRAALDLAPAYIPARCGAAAALLAAAQHHIRMGALGVPFSYCVTWGLKWMQQHRHILLDLISG